MPPIDIARHTYRYVARAWVIGNGVMIDSSDFSDIALVENRERIGKGVSSSRQRRTDLAIMRKQKRLFLCIFRLSRRHSR